jgi:hypothetical protein
MLFSCTWNEKRKNTSAELTVATMNRFWLGRNRRSSPLGRFSNAVKARLVCDRVGMLNFSLSLTTTESEHQKLATLSYIKTKYSFYFCIKSSFFFTYFILFLLQRGLVRTGKFYLKLEGSGRLLRWEWTATIESQMSARPPSQWRKV